MSEPSKKALAFVARWACSMCSESLGPGDEMPECEYCTDHRRWHAQCLDDFAAQAYAEGAKAMRVACARHVDDADEDLPKHMLASDLRALPLPAHVSNDLICNATWNGERCGKAAGHEQHHATTDGLVIWVDDATGSKPHRSAPEPAKGDE